MEIVLGSKFRAAVNDATAADLGSVCELARATASVWFTTEQQALLTKLAEFDIPQLLARGAFDAGVISAGTPDRMAVSVPGSEPAIRAILNLLAGAGLQPFSFAYENDGCLAANLTPQRPDSVDRLSFQKSTKGLRGHTDASFNPSPTEFQPGSYSPSPDFLALGCIRNPDSVPTKITKLSRVLSRLKGEHISALCESKFFLYPQPSFELPGDAVRVGPVLWRDKTDTMCCRCSHTNIAVDESTFPAHAEALTSFLDHVSNEVEEFVLAPGEILILNNRLVVHGRGQIGKSWHNRARWLLRVYAYGPSTPHSSAGMADRSWVVR